jgi:hypothetical protein
MADKTHNGYFAREPRGRAYEVLVRAVASLSSRALLEVRSYEFLSSEGVRILEQLEPWCVRSDLRKSWPGTQLLTGVAEIYEYKIEEATVAILESVVDRLYAWSAPLPEDLSFLREDGSVVMYSIGHEEEGGVTLSEEEKKVLLSKGPEAADCIVWSERR